MPKIDIAVVPTREGSGFRRHSTQSVPNAFGGNWVTPAMISVSISCALSPGNRSSQHLWHSAEDEFVHVLEGGRLDKVPHLAGSVARGEAALRAPLPANIP